MGSSPDILIVGATGCVGRRLTDTLVTEGHALRCVARRTQPLGDKVQMMAGDLRDHDFMQRTLDGIDTAYYLVHSLSAGEDRFMERDRELAETFLAAAESSGLRRIIYLSGLGGAMDDLSDHLRSRQQVGGILSSGKPSTTILRAAIIIGAGSASFEIMRFIVRTQLLLPQIDWLETRCQPIAIDNAIHYLAACHGEEQTSGKVYDIGGPEVLTYREMLDEIARLVETINLYFPVPWYSPRIAASLIGLFSRVNGDVALSLLKSMRNDVVCQNDLIKAVLPQKLLPFGEAVSLALSGERNHK